MILADENIHSFIIKTLREANFKVISVSETSHGIKDEEVIRWAIKNNFLLLTEDKDFGEWVFAHPSLTYVLYFCAIILKNIKK